MAQFSKTDCEGFYRRDFLKVGSAGLLGLTLPQLLRLEARARASEAQTGAAANRHADGVHRRKLRVDVVWRSRLGFGLSLVGHVVRHCVNTEINNRSDRVFNVKGYSPGV